MSFNSVLFIEQSALMEIPRIEYIKITEKSTRNDSHLSETFDVMKIYDRSLFINFFLDFQSFYFIKDCDMFSGDFSREKCT